MKIELTIARNGQAKGTVGWLAENAKVIEIKPNKDGHAMAVLGDGEGKFITLLAVHDEGAEPTQVDRHTGISPYAIGFPVTDACWEVVKMMAELAVEEMKEPRNVADDYDVVIKRGGE